MWSTILSFLKGKVFTEAGSLLIPLILILSIFVIWNSDTILTKFGYETKSSLKVKVVQLTEQVSRLEEANEKLKDSLIKAEQGKTISEEAISELCLVKEETKNKVDSVIDRRKAEAVRIKELHKEENITKESITPVTESKGTQKVIEVPMTKEDALSYNNISALNEAYDELFGDA